MNPDNLASPEPIEVRLHHLLGNAYSGHGISTWCFSPRSGELFFSSSPHESEMEKFFRLSGCEDYAFQKALDLEVPFLMSDQIAMIWIGEYAPLSNEAKMLVLLGPMFFASTSGEYIEALVRKMMFDGEISRAQAQTYRTVLADVPVVPAQTVVSYARMLHFTIWGKAIGASSIHYQTQSLKTASHPEADPSKAPNWVDYSQVHSQEEIFLQCVRDGNLNYWEVLDGLNYSVLDLPLSNNPVRSELYKLVSHAALCSRAAIEGGLSPKVALHLQSEYLHQADKLTRVTEIRELNLKLLDDFIHHVHEVKTQTGLSRPIQECCEFISTHLTEDLSVQRIAKQIGYTEYYLTRKFQKETGVRLADYIKDARLNYAKVCLLSSDRSVEEISDLLQFSSRNYFTRVFREKTGMTPTEFRAQQMHVD